MKIQYNKFVPYYGNKTTETPVIFKYVNDTKTFVDVFGGSGSVGVCYKELNPKTKVIYNDNNERVYRLINIFRNRLVYDEIEKWNDYGKIRKKQFDTEEECKEDFYNLFNSIESDDMKLVVMCLYSTYCSYVLSDDKRQFIVHYKNLKGKWGVERRVIHHDNYYETYNKLEEICNLDYKSILKKYKNNKSATLYLDPPYLPKKVSYGNGFNDKDLDYIIEYMKDCKCKVILNPNYNDYYKNKIETNNHLVLKEIYDKQYRARGKNKDKHCIISN